MRVPRVLQGIPPSALGLGSPPPLLAAAVLGQNGSAAPPQHPAPPPAAPRHPALPRPPPRCPPCCSPGCQSSIVGPLPLQFMARSGGTAPPCTPPFLASSLQGQEKDAGSWCSAPPNHSPAQQAGEGREEITGGGVWWRSLGLETIEGVLGGLSGPHTAWPGQGDGGDKCQSSPSAP